MTGVPLKKFPELFKNTFSEYFEDNPMKHAAALAYYTVFSLPGILILALYFAGMFWGEKAVSGQLQAQISALAGPEAGEQIGQIIANASQPAKGWLMQVVGIGALIFSATTAFASLQDALNSMWEVKPKPEKGLLRLVVSRLLSLAMIVSIGFFLLVSLSVEALLGLLKDELQALVPDLSFTTVYIMNLGISLVVITVLFALIFKILPDAKVQWKNVWIGAILTTVLFLIGKFLIGFYLGKSDFTGTYGAAGSLVVILAWIYYSSLILLLGAEFTQVYSKMSGSRIEPAKHAVRIKHQDVELE